MSNPLSLVQSLLAKALELPVSERSIWLDRCDADDAVVREVRELLLHCERSNNPLNQALPIELLEKVAAGSTGESASLVDADPAETGSSSSRVPADGGCSETTIVGMTPPGTEASGVLPTLPGYELLEEIARGGMGVVYRARQTKLGRIVAIKFLIAGRFANDELRRRFLSETEAVAQLDHPNIVTLHETGELDGLPYFSMAFVDGVSLRGLLRSGPLEPRRAATLVSKVAGALRFAHERGIIHRDLKPENILLDSSGEPRVADFGLAKQVSRENDLTQTGQVLGTASFMAPEQAAGRLQDVGPLSDVYSLGATLYCLLCARPPFEAASVAETLKQVQESEAPPLRLLNANIPRDLETICHRALQKDPNRRYASMADMETDLTRHLAGDFIFARPVSSLEKAARWARRNFAVSILSATAVILLVSLAVISALAYIRGASQLAKITQSEQDLRVQISKEAFEKAVSAYAEGRHIDAESDFLRSIGLLPTGHLLRAQHLNIAWDRATRGRCSETQALPHKDGAKIAEYSPDAGRILTVSLGGIVRLWDSHTGSPIGTPLNHRSRSTSAAFSPDGQTVVTVGNDVQLWDGHTGAYIKKLADGRFDRVKISPSGNAIAVFGGGNSLLIYTNTKRDAISLGNIEEVNFNEDGSMIATIGGRNEIDGFVMGGGNRRAEVRDVISGSLHYRSPEGPTIDCLASFTSAQHQIVIGDTKSLLLVDPKSGQQIRELAKRHGNPRTSFSPDGEHYALISARDTIAIHSFQSTAQIEEIKIASNSGISDISFSPNGRHILGCSRDNTVSIWDWRHGVRVCGPFRHQSQLNKVSFSPDGAHVLTASSDGTARVWDLPPPPQLLRCKSGQIAKPPAFNRPGTHLVVISANEAIIFKAGYWTEVGRFSHADEIETAALSDDGRFLVVSASRVPVLYCWDVLQQRPIPNEFNFGLHCRVGFDSRTKEFVVLDGSMLRAWNPELRNVTNLCRFSRGLRVFGPSGRIAVEHPAPDGRCNVVNCTEVGSCSTSLEDMPLFSSGKFNANESKLIVIETKNAVSTWDAATGLRTAGPIRNVDPFTWAAFVSPQDEQIIAASDSRMRRWDLATLMEVGPEIPGTSAAVDSQGHWIVQISDKFPSGIMIWDLEPSRPHFAGDFETLQAFVHRRISADYQVSAVDPEFTLQSLPYGRRVWQERHGARERRTHAFHESMIRLCAREHDRFGLEFHLARLAEEFPTSESFDELCKLSMELEPVSAVRLAPDKVLLGRMVVARIAELPAEDLLDWAVAFAEIGRHEEAMQFLGGLAKQVPLGRSTPIGRTATGSLLVDFLGKRGKGESSWAIELLAQFAADSGVINAIPDPSPGQIAYVTKDGEIVSISLPSRERRVRALGIKSCPHVSWHAGTNQWFFFDGSRLLSVADDESAEVIYHRDLKAPPVQATFSADGRKLAWGAPSPNVPELLVEDFETRRQSSLGSSYDPAWSPDGERLAYLKWTGGAWSLAIWTPDGKTRLLNAPLHKGLCAYPSFSPDGTLIALGMAAPDGTRQIGVIDPATFRTRLITSKGELNDKPAFSPDGRHVAFLRRTGSKNSLCVIDLETEHEDVLAEDAALVRPAWKTLKNE